MVKILLLPLFVFQMAAQEISPTVTLVPTVISTPTPYPGDHFEPNNGRESASIINLGETYDSLTLDPSASSGQAPGDVDFYTVYLKAGQLVRVSTFVDGPADTRLTVTSASGEFLGFNDDRSAVDLGSTIALTTPYEGWFLLEISSPTPFGGGYQLLVALEAPTITPTPTRTGTPEPTFTPLPTGTPTITPTPYTSKDQGEPNNTPEQAMEIIPGTTYPFTLGPIGTDTHDFFTFLAKAGVNYTCQTSELKGVDTLLRAYAGPIGQGVLIAENDDQAPANLGSVITFQLATNQPVFVVAETRAGYGSYQLLCGVKPAPSSGGNGSASTPTLSPTPTSPAVKTLRFELFIDHNTDLKLSPAEGVSGLKVLVNDQEFTIQDGLLLLELPAGEITYISVPYLHLSYSLDPKLPTLSIPLPAVALPVLLP